MKNCTNKSYTDHDYKCLEARQIAFKLTIPSGKGKQVVTLQICLCEIYLKWKLEVISVS